MTNMPIPEKFVRVARWVKAEYKLTCPADLTLEDIIRKYEADELEMEFEQVIDVSEKWELISEEALSD